MPKRPNLRSELRQSAAVSGATPPALRLVIEYRPITGLRPDERNPRRHSRRQVRQIARSLTEFGFITPLVVAGDRIVCGHGRLLAARELGLNEVPVVGVGHLSDAQLLAFQVADNKLCENATWDEQLLGRALLELEVVHDFDLTLTGFDIAEQDRLMGEAVAPPDPDDNAPPAGPAVCRPGDEWTVLGHKVVCGDARLEAVHASLMAGERASVVFTDPPYNLASRQIGGRGRVKHADFEMAAGEMTEAEYTAFLGAPFRWMAAALRPGGLVYICIDWRHVHEAIVAGRQSFESLRNICVWAKPHPGQGSFYRSQHEFVLLFKVAGGEAQNNIRQGRYGRNRSNLWSYPSPASFGGAGEEGSLLSAHPTPKPVAMVADAILDCTARGDIVLDPFLGGGATLIAAERTGRRCCAIEIDPKYIDVALRRIARLAGEDPRRRADGRRFSDLEAEAVDGGS